MLNTASLMFPHTQGPPKYLLEAVQKQHTQEKVDTGSCLLYS